MDTPNSKLGETKQTDIQAPWFLLKESKIHTADAVTKN